jgi:uncharacterized protein involved in response to NO
MPSTDRLIRVTFALPQRCRSTIAVSPRHEETLSLHHNCDAVGPDGAPVCPEPEYVMALAALDGRPTALWSLAFRPFFLAAGLWAPLAVALWIVLLVSGGTLPSRFDPPTWHLHAMLFGFVLATIAGFLLTAIPNWTGRQPVQGRLLIGLAILWLLGRVSCFVSAFLPLWLAAGVDLAFPLMLCTLAGCEIIAARNWRNLLIPMPIGVLAVADLLMYLELAGIDVPTGFGWRLAVVAIIALISVIGGRIIPAFTRNWLVGRGVSSLPAEHGLLDRMALGMLHAGLLGWALFPTSQTVAAILIVAAMLNLARLGRWRGFAVASELLLAILHVGYAWLVLGTALLAVSMFSTAVPEAAAIHALTAGAIGTMVLAVMTRVTLGHTGRRLTADRLTSAIYILITAAAVTRVAAAWVGESTILLNLSAILWVASFALFLLCYGPMLISPKLAAG